MKPKKLQITERDKKLLIVLLVVVLIAGVGLGILYPLMQKGSMLSAEYEKASALMQENEGKLDTLPAVQTNEKNIEKNIAKTQKSFYPVMQSMQIDQLLTEMALGQGVTMTSLNISLPTEVEYAQVAGYVNNQTQTADGQTTEAPTYDGIFVAQVQANMSGARTTLQGLLDQYAAQEPKIRITNYAWSTNSSRNGDSKDATLSVSLELYMYQDEEEYIASQQELESQEAAEAAASDAAATDTTE